MKAIVVGAGFAGLSAAYRLQQAGWTVRVFEAADRVGGRVHSLKRGPYSLELGATTLSSGFSDYNQLCEELGLTGDVVEAGSLVYVMRAGRLFPLDGRHALKSLVSGALGQRSLLALLRAGRDFAKLQPRMNALDVSACYRYDTESARTYAERRLTREFYDVLVDPLIRTYTLRRAEDVSCLEWFSAVSSLIGQRMCGMRGGLQKLPNAIAARLDVQLGCSVRRVARAGNGVEVELRLPDGGDTVETAQACVIATRLPEAAQLFAEFGAKAAPLIDKLPYNRIICAHLGYRVRTVNRAVGVMVPTIEHGDISLVWCEHNKNSQVAPPGHSLILAYFDAAVADKYYGQDDEALAHIGQEFVERLFPELRGHRDMMHISRIPLGIPNPTTGAYAALHALKGQLAATDRMQFAGDYFTCTGQNSAIHYGNLAARNLIATFGPAGTAA